MQYQIWAGNETCVTCVNDHPSPSLIDAAIVVREAFQAWPVSFVNIASVERSPAGGYPIVATFQRMSDGRIVRRIAEMTSDIIET